MKRVNHGAQYQISIDGVPRTYRDRQDIALQTARFLKSRHPNSTVTLKDSMALKMRPTGLGHGVYKDDIDYGVFCGEWCIGRISDAHRPRVSALVLGAART